MNPISYKTKAANKETAQKEWVILDANSQIVGRLATKVATLLRGKHKPNFTPHVDCGDNVIIINAEKVRFSGKKWENKQYISHTGYPGGQKVVTPIEIKASHPTRILERAIKGMLPKNRLGRALFNNLFVYAGDVHPHIAQQPKPLS